jgi:enamine deaminase RidA (YjgF/YER057c/UK114 family)
MVKSTGIAQVMIRKARKRAMEGLDVENLSEGERDELTALGILSTLGDVQPSPKVSPRKGFTSVQKRAIHAPSVLNEAYDYSKPSSFSRGLSLDLGDYRLLLISGTASVDEEGETAHVGDFRAQCWRTYRNITSLLESEGAGWNDVFRCTCYLRDIERDYEEFNAIRTAFFRWLGVDPLPASVGVQARLCRENLLVEIETIAILKREE